jgi:hypothetical protein
MDERGEGQGEMRSNAERVGGKEGILHLAVRPMFLVFRRRTFRPVEYRGGSHARSQ